MKRVVNQAVSVLFNNLWKSTVTLSPHGV